MTIIGSIHGGSLSPAIIFNNHKPPLRHRHRHQRPPTPPIFISTNLSDINPNNLRDLCTTCNHSFHRFPNISPDGKVEPVDVDKLRTAVSHSSVVVSVFSRSELVTGGGDWYRRMIPLTPVTGELVGFGRAVGDDALTASIYDVMKVKVVTPRLQGRGIGRIILQRIIRLTKNSQDVKCCRLLTNKGIYDIAALCSDQDMKFFKACGFGDDMLGSTTMMYTRKSGSDLDVSAGRKLLMVPPLRKP
ncbi:putative acyl-CoA N-acyltransferase, glucosamine 6-phosphate N-acetyltransferase [Helianthus annuus]|nr:putative acyl-CoA N-acyltransferase, glucosamine 6-phosphate N-acetyltransferase [Helianthus annuus]